METEKLRMLKKLINKHLFTSTNMCINNSTCTAKINELSHRLRHFTFAHRSASLY